MFFQFFFFCCSVKILLKYYLHIAMVIFHPSTYCTVLVIKVSNMKSGVKQAQLRVFHGFQERLSVKNEMCM